MPRATACVSIPDILVALSSSGYERATLNEISGEREIKFSHANSYDRSSSRGREVSKERIFIYIKFVPF